MCRLLPSEVAKFRPDLISMTHSLAAGKAAQQENRLKMAAINAPIFAAKRDEQQATAAMGFKKYDRRFRNSRRYWRKTKKNACGAT